MNLTAQLYLNLIHGGAARLAEERQSINDLNVFPIPDGDTGDNMYMTIDAGSHVPAEASLGKMAEAISQGMLLGARGNSGVILSRIFAGIAKGLKDKEEADIASFTEAMKKGVDEAYHAVAEPVEGTILTVLREGVEAAAGSASLEEFMDLWIAGMDLSLQHTPELLAVLKKAGVVDSGGAGLLLIGEGMRDALNGKLIADNPGAVASTAGGPVDLNAFTEDSILEFGYCTEFLLRLQRSKVDLDSFDESVIHDWLQTRGDSLVFFRDGSIIKVHVHTKDPGAILSRCREWGEFLTIKVENMTLQHHGNHMDERFRTARKKLGIVTVAAGEGLTATFREMGADIVIQGGQTMNPPVESFLDAFREVNADTVLVFPNNGNIILTARQAAALYTDSRIEVIPTSTLGEGYYSLANLNADLPVEEMTSSLKEAAESVTTGLVSKAIRDAENARAGEYIGICGKDILTASPSREEAVRNLADKLQATQADILILFSGKDSPADEAARLQRELEIECPRTEVILIDGGQPVYDYIIVLC